MRDPVITAIFRELVEAFGFEASAALITARYGAFSKGTLSKICGGEADVPLSLAIALEDALGRFPLTDYTAARRRDRTRGGDLSELASECMTTAGAAHAAMARALSPSGEGGAAVTEGERALLVAALTLAGERIAEALAAVQGGEGRE